MNAGPGRHDPPVSLCVLLSDDLLECRVSPQRKAGRRLRSGRRPGHAATGKEPDKGTQVTDYPLKGVVKKVDLARGSLMIAHEAIPGFMDAMTMPFFYSDRALLESLALGDVVEGTLHVETSAAS